jgi:hypothetical protein
MSDEQFSAEEIAMGAIGRVRRARALVFLIEEETKRNRDKRRTMSLAASPEAQYDIDAIFHADNLLFEGNLPGEKNNAYVASYRNAKRSTSRVTIRNIESASKSWSVLVPDDLTLRAEVLHQLSMKYELIESRTKSISRTFGIGTSDFEEAFFQTFGFPISEIFRSKKGFLQQFFRRSH